jgi:hypothetical protein
VSETLPIPAQIGRDSFARQDPCFPAFFSPSWESRCQSAVAGTVVWTGDAFRQWVNRASTLKAAFGRSSSSRSAPPFLSGSGTNQVVNPKGSLKPRAREFGARSRARMVRRRWTPNRRELSQREPCVASPFVTRGKTNTPRVRNSRRPQLTRRSAVIPQNEKAPPVGLEPTTSRLTEPKREHRKTRKSPRDIAILYHRSAIASAFTHLQFFSGVIGSRELKTVVYRHAGMGTCRCRRLVNSPVGRNSRWTRNPLDG